MSDIYAPSLADLADTPMDAGIWWLSVARALDALDERLADDAAADEGPSGTFDEVVRREPSLSNPAQQVAADRVRLIDRARRLRHVVSSAAGDPRRVPDVSGELATLAHAERRYRERGRALVWDAYNRDIGGG